MKHCPKCGSTNIGSLVFYRPSIWKCLDCGYEGAFIIEDITLGEKIQEHIQKRRDIVDGVKPHVDDLDGIADNWQITLEDHGKSVAVSTVEGKNCVG